MSEVGTKTRRTLLVLQEDDGKIEKLLRAMVFKGDDESEIHFLDRDRNVFASAWLQTKGRIGNYGFTTRRLHISFENRRVLGKRFEAIEKFLLEEWHRAERSVDIGRRNRRKALIIDFEEDHTAAGDCVREVSNAVFDEFPQMVDVTDGSSFLAYIDHKNMGRLALLVAFMSVASVCVLVYQALHITKIESPSVDNVVSIEILGFLSAFVGSLLLRFRDRIFRYPEDELEPAKRRPWTLSRLLKMALWWFLFAGLPFFTAA